MKKGVRLLNLIYFNKNPNFVNLIFNIRHSAFGHPPAKLPLEKNGFLWYSDLIIVYEKPTR